MAMLLFKRKAVAWTPPRLTSNPRLRVPLALFAAVMAAFSLLRLAIYLDVRERFAPASAAEVLRGFWVGLRFDLTIAAIVVAPFVAVLGVAPRRVLSRKGFGWAV